MWLISSILLATPFLQGPGKESPLNGQIRRVRIALLFAGVGQSRFDYGTDLFPAPEKPPIGQAVSICCMVRGQNNMGRTFSQGSRQSDRPFRRGTLERRQTDRPFRAGRMARPSLSGTCSGTQPTIGQAFSGCVAAADGQTVSGRGGPRCGSFPQNGVDYGTDLFSKGGERNGRPLARPIGDGSGDGTLKDPVVGVEGR